MKIPLALSLLFLAAASEAKVYERCEFAKELVEDQVGWDLRWEMGPPTYQPVPLHLQFKGYID